VIYVEENAGNAIILGAHIKTINLSISNIYPILALQDNGCKQRLFTLRRNREMERPGFLILPGSGAHRTMQPALEKYTSQILLGKKSVNLNCLN
jgi:hypothetical protein